MDDQGSWMGGQSPALVILAFLEADCANSDYRNEVLSLGRKLNLTRDINCNGNWIVHEPVDDGDLETDGHLPSSVSGSLNDIQPVVEPQWPGNGEVPANLRRVAQELREIADDIEDAIVARATSNLRRNISTSPSENWYNHLTWEVERVMRQGVGLENLPQERVIMALTLTLVKGVCEQAPLLLRDLFNAALRYTSRR